MTVDQIVVMQNEKDFFLWGTLFETLANNIYLCKVRLKMFEDCVKMH